MPNPADPTRSIASARAPGRSRRGFARGAHLAVVLCAALLPALTSCGGGDAALPPPAPLQPPLARLWLPVFGAPESALLFDASDSQSPGGELAQYVLDFGDGSPAQVQASPIAHYTYAADGVYAVQLTVIDIEGNSATVQSELTVRDDPPTCSTDSDCDTGERCQLICFAEVGSGADADRAPRRAASAKAQGSGAR